MELTTTIKATARVCATLEEDGTLSLKVFGAADYAEGVSTTAEVSGSELPAETSDAVKAALSNALLAAAEKLGPRIQRAVHTSATVAAAHGEI